MKALFQTRLFGCTLRASVEQPQPQVRILKMKKLFQVAVLGAMLTTGAFGLAHAAEKSCCASTDGTTPKCCVKGGGTAPCCKK
jgi:hypothetical protein